MVPKIYQKLLTDLKEKIHKARSIAARTVNNQILSVYWEIGKSIGEMEKAAGWGAKTIDRLAADLKVEFPEMTGLSTRSLRYMREFYKAYPASLFLQQPAAELSPSKTKKTPTQKDSILQQPAAKLPAVRDALAQLSWTHHQVILDRAKSLEDRLFYVHKTIENGWSRNVLTFHMEQKLHERQGKAITNFEHTLPNTHSDLARETFKAPYLLDFLDVSEETKERDLEKALIAHIKSFLLELGRGFAYVGNQYNIQVENDEFFLDLLFFNTNLNCYIIFELKMGEFQPEYAGKLNFYVNAVDEKIKGRQHNRTIGVLLCKTANKTVIRYALEGVTKPIAVSNYKLSAALPKRIELEMPSIAEWERKLQEESEKLKTNAEKRFDKLKTKLASLERDRLETSVTPTLLKKTLTSSIKPLFENLIHRTQEFQGYFLDHQYFFQIDSKTIATLDELVSVWSMEQNIKDMVDTSLACLLKGFKFAGTKAFDYWAQLIFVKQEYYYGLKLTNYNDQKVFIKKLYTQQLTSEDIRSASDLVCNQILDAIEPHLN